MNDAAVEAVERVVRYMYTNLGDDIAIDDMARTAMFSKFHFSRMFHEVTGITPGRFLSAVRLYAAKRLLLATELTITDICYRVGYSSVGTFSSRFTAVVGTSPSAYRASRGFLPQLPLNRRRNGWATVSGMIKGQGFTPSAQPSELIFVGVFPDPIIQCPPIRYTVLREAGEYAIEDVPPGTWYILGYSFAPDDDGVLCDPVNDEQPPSVAIHGPVMIRRHEITGCVDVQLRPMQVIDPPVLLACVDTQSESLDETGT